VSKISPEQAIEIAELREQGWSHERLARKFGVTAGAIHYHCLKAGALSPRSPGKIDVAGQPPVARRDGKIQRRFTPEEDDRMQALSRQGLSTNKIGELMGRAPTSVMMRLYALAIHEEFAESEAA
jgi:hypothetical protein